MPPPECFRYADPTKQDFEPHDGSLVPDLSRVVWSFFEDEVVDKMLGPALLARFRPFVTDHYARIFGPEYAAEAAAWPQRARGRLMLRRPGYFLAPHLDPKKVLFTTLIYFARPGDNEEHGTQLYRVDRPFQASSLKTYYPQQHGYQCELARTVPFRPNTGFAFMNGEDRALRVPVLHDAGRARLRRSRAAAAAGSAGPLRRRRPDTVSPSQSP